MQCDRHLGFLWLCPSKPLDEAQNHLAHAKRELARGEGDTSELNQKSSVPPMPFDFQDITKKIRELARRLTEWDMERMAKDAILSALVVVLASWKRPTAHQKYREARALDWGFHCHSKKL